MIRMRKSVVVGCALAIAPALALAESSTTVGIGFDYSEGDYGESDTSRTWQIPVTIRHETGPFILKLNVPYVRSSGLAAPGGDRSSDTKDTQSGLGDVTATAMYAAYYNSAAQFGIDVGTKIKFATADDSNSLLTTGENDYSVLADLYKAFGATTVFGTVGWTSKGDPSGVDYRDPWFFSLGFSNKLSDANSWGVSYDFRQKLTSSGDPVSEAMLFFTHRYSKEWRVQAYAVTGFSDASPDIGGGMSLSYSF